MIWSEVTAALHGRTATVKWIVPTATGYPTVRDHTGIIEVRIQREWEVTRYSEPAQVARLKLSTFRVVPPPHAEVKLDVPES